MQKCQKTGGEKERKSWEKPKITDSQNFIILLTINLKKCMLKKLLLLSSTQDTFQENKHEKNPSNTLFNSFEKQLHPRVPHSSEPSKYQGLIPFDSAKLLSDSNIFLSCNLNKAIKEILFLVSPPLAPLFFNYASSFCSVNTAK